MRTLEELMPSAADISAGYPASAGPAKSPSGSAAMGRIASGAIRIESLNHTYSASGRVTNALQDIRLDVAPGKFVVIVGPSGCGKSSLLMMMAGLLAPSSGEVVCGGRRMTAPDPDVVGVVFQEASLYPW